MWNAIQGVWGCDGLGFWLVGLRLVGFWYSCCYLLTWLLHVSWVRLIVLFTCYCAVLFETVFV